MLTSNTEVQKLIDFIDALTGNIVDQVKKNEFDGINSLIEQRHALLEELIKLSAPDVSLTDYLLDLQKRDQFIIEIIQKELEETRTSLLNLNNLKKYINV